MLSKMAIEDLGQLQKDGFQPSFEQIIRLNALGIIAERGKHASTVCAAPRTAWAGSTPIFEQTIQSEKWYAEYAVQWWIGDSLFISLAWACAHSNVSGFFEQWTVEKQCRRAIEKWAKGLDCTQSQLISAVSYAISGGEQRVDLPEGPLSQQEDVTGCPYTSIVNDAIAANFGLTPERIELMPHRRVVDILKRYAANQLALSGGTADFESGAKTAAYVAYDDLLISIRQGAKHG